MMTLLGRAAAGFQGAPVSHGLVVSRPWSPTRSANKLPLTALPEPRQLDDALPRPGAELASAQPPPCERPPQGALLLLPGAELPTGGGPPKGHSAK